MRQTVVLSHKQPDMPEHFDWLIDQPEIQSEHRLLTFRVFERPDQSPRFTAERLALHRAHYLRFQGDIGGDRGHVTRICRGDVLVYTPGQTQLNMEIRWADRTICYSAQREDEANMWTFTATAMPAP